MWFLGRIVKDTTYIPPRRYFWNSLSSLNRKIEEKCIGLSIKERNKQRVTQESKIEISEEIMNQINKKYLYQRQKGIVLSMFVTSWEGNIISIKLKDNMLHVKLVKKKQKNIEEKIKTNELWWPYDKKKIGMKRTRRVW